MGILVYSSLWVMQDLHHQPECPRRAPSFTQVELDSFTPEQMVQPGAR